MAATTTAFEAEVLATLPGGIKNLHLNPSAESSLANVGVTGASGAALARSSIQAKSGANSFQMIQGSAAQGMDLRNPTTPGRAPIVAGKRYSAAAEFYPNTL